MMQRRALLKFSPVALALPVRAQRTESTLPKLGSTLQLPDVTLLNGEVWAAQKQAFSTLVVYWWAR